MASAPTFLKWTRTSRDFDFVLISELVQDPELDREEWKPQPTHVREIVAKLHTDHECIEFWLSGGNEPVWLLPSTFANPYPLHVHRHLGLITSRFLRELGTPAEIFCRTSADPKREHQLVTPEGKLDLDGKLYKPVEQIVRVVEFETPAAILCDATKTGVLQTYKQAYFDLVASGFRLGPTLQGTLRLYFRFVGSPRHVRGFSKLSLKFWPALEVVVAPERHIEIDLKGTAASFPVGLQFVLQRDPSDAKTKCTAALLHSDGTLVEVALPSTATANLFKLVDADNRHPGFFVSVAEAIGPGEFWTDVSLLHSPRALPTNPLDLGWLFSMSGEGEPAAHVTPAGLTTMVEAQARIVSVSPPIPIVSH